MGLTQLGYGLMSLQAQMAMNQQNVQLTREINEQNIAANTEQANIAYQRSLPIAQVRDLMDAGMSKAGALNKLSGGGVYQAPIIQSNAPHLDPIGANFLPIMEAIEKFASIPSNVQQYQENAAQLDLLHQTLRENERESQRKTQMFEYQLWEKQHGKKVAVALDEAKNFILNKMFASDKDYGDFKTLRGLVRELGIADAKELKDLPSSAWTELESSVRDGAAAAREEREQNNRDTSAADAHRLSLLREKLAKIDVKYYDKEKHEKLLNLMRQGEGLIQQNNLTFAQLTAQNMENLVREAGIETEAEAQAIAAYVEKLANDDELQQQLYQQGLNDSSGGPARRGLRQALRDFGELLKSVKLSGGKYSITKQVQVNR